MSLRLKTPPQVEPVTVGEAKGFLKQEGGVDDGVIRPLIASCRESGEEETGRAWLTQSLELVLACWPAVIKLERPPVQSVTSLTYLDQDGIVQTLVEGVDFQVLYDYFTPIVAPYPGKAWPTVQAGMLEAIRLEYVAGFGDTADKVPKRYRQGLLALMGFLYEEGRSAVIVGTTGQELPRTVSDLWAFDHVAPI